MRKSNGESMSYILESDHEAKRLEIQKEISAYSISEELEGVSFQNKTVLDAGCGGGDVSHFILSNFQNVDLVGCDLSDIRVAHAQKKNPKGKFFQSNLNKIGLEDNSVDLIVCRYVFEYLKDPISVLSEFKRVLKPGGEVLLIDIDGIFTNFYTKDEGFNKKLKIVSSLLEVDLFAGRKLPALMGLSHFKSIQTKMTSHHFKGQDLKREIRNYQLRFKAIEDQLKEILGSKNAKIFENQYLHFLEDPSSVLFFNKFIVKGEF